MKKFLITLCLVFASCLLGFANNERPNIIFILADDLGYGDLGCYGQELIQTPNMDKLAKDGIRFTQHYAGSPVCASSRAVLMTGLHTGSATVKGNMQHPSGIGQIPLPSYETTIAKVLQENGYKTAMFGKWGLGNVDTEGNPLDRGFDQFCGYTDQVLAHNAFPEYLIEGTQKIPLKNVVNYLDPNAWHKGLGSYSTEKIEFSQDYFISGALSFIEENKSQPFFLYLPLIIPHDNGEAPMGERMEVPNNGIYEDTDWFSDSKAYAASITRMDADIGKIRTKLEELGISENTLLIFTSDNGPVHPKAIYTEFFKSNGGLRGYKRDLYEGGIKEPFIAYWPGKIKAGSESDHPSGFHDFFATACDLTGINAQVQTDGISYKNALLGKKQKQHEYLYWEFPINSAGNGYGSQVAVRMGKWKGIRVDLLNNPDAPLELYDLDTDPSETKDVAAQHPKIVEKIDLIMRTAHQPSPHFPTLLK